LGNVDPKPVKVLVDTNILVRYLVNQPLEQAEKAANLLEGSHEILIAPHILAETFFVLTSFYQVSVGATIDSLLVVLGRVNIEVLGIEHSLAVAALELVRPSKRISLPDALLWAQARSNNSAMKVATFDRKFPQDEIELLTL
jgi:predicted nucleic acid-binding protein